MHAQLRSARASRNRFNKTRLAGHRCQRRSANNIVNRRSTCAWDDSLKRACVGTSDGPIRTVTEPAGALSKADSSLTSSEIVH